ncbi:putative phosphoacetylglucosamine mutase, partial [Operophtera brumata]
SKTWLSFDPEFQIPLGFDQSTLVEASRASLLEHVVYRMGLLAVLRSRVKNGRTIGIMITASHNLEPDNGKIRQKLPVYGAYSPSLHVDGANGVGGKKLNIIRKSLDGELDLNLFNLGGNGGKLNLNKPPVGVKHEPFQRVASLDGDGDRIVYYYLDDKERMHLLDGDRIATLLASYITELLRSCEASDLTLGLVQTAYANGASTNYISEELKIPVSCVKTGVKHLHHAALSYDVGVYFEANGHGTVLLDFIDMTNETVGDAISDLFMVETVLCARGHNVREWMSAYTDLPCRQLKVTVKDRNAISTTDAERQCTEPEGLQNRINELVSGYKDGRSFVRPSGTEDVVRVYAEADTQESRINELVSGYKDGRSFVRPSGTEDVVRVYAKADTQESRINELVSGYKDGRSFVRPSGTEDVVRVYAEADTQESRINELVSGYKDGRSFVRPSGTEDVVRVYAEADTQKGTRTDASSCVPPPLRTWCECTQRPIRKR